VLRWEMKMLGREETKKIRSQEGRKGRSVKFMCGDEY
jgi:hypothetical protein